MYLLCRLLRTSPQLQSCIAAQGTPAVWKRVPLYPVIPTGARKQCGPGLDSHVAGSES